MPLLQSAFSLARQIRYRLKEKLGDWRYGIHSADSFLPADIINTSPEFHPYGAISYDQFNQILDQLEVRPGVDVFLDYGCGMGRPLVMSATRPFRKVIGIELSPGLTELARRNVTDTRANLQCHDIELHNIDAQQYQVPSDVSVVFMCSPFSGSVLRAVLDKIHQSVITHPRQVRIIYAYMQGQNCLEAIRPMIPYLTDFKPMSASGRGLALAQCTINLHCNASVGTIPIAA
jgi:precorrin-6B methylase 2